MLTTGRVPERARKLASRLDKAAYLLLAIVLVAVILFVTLNTTVFAADDKSGFDIVFNPDGTKINAGQLKVQLDFYPHEGSLSYQEQYIEEFDILNPALIKKKRWP